MEDIYIYCTKSFPLTGPLIEPYMVLLRHLVPGRMELIAWAIFLKLLK